MGTIKSLSNDYGGWGFAGGADLPTQGIDPMYEFEKKYGWSYGGAIKGNHELRFDKPAFRAEETHKFKFLGFQWATNQEPEGSEMQLYEYAVWYEADPEIDGDKSAILIEPATILAKNEEAVKIKAHRAISPDYDEKLDRVKVVIRRFQGC